MEIIIGREEGNHRLHIVAGGRQFNIGGVDSVPASVSRQHCQLSIDGAGQMTLKNLKERNFTYVDGRPIDTKKVTSDSIIELGTNRYRLNLSQVLALITPQSSQPNLQQRAQAPTFSLRPLQPVWENYHEQRLQFQLAEQRKNNWKAGGGLLSTAGVLFAFIPIPELGNSRYIFAGAALLVGIYFFIRGFDTSDSLVVKLDNLEKKFRKKYVCPNPQCHHFMGGRPYEDLQDIKKCPYCGCLYSH